MCWKVTFFADAITNTNADVITSTNTYAITNTNTDVEMTELFCTWPAGGVTDHPIPPLLWSPSSVVEITANTRKNYLRPLDSYFLSQKSSMPRVSFKFLQFDRVVSFSLWVFLFWKVQVFLEAGPGSNWMWKNRRRKTKEPCCSRWMRLDGMGTCTGGVRYNANNCNKRSNVSST